VAGFELLALGMRKKEKVRRLALVGSALVGVGAAFTLFEAAEHGGELVYSYAGGVGTRSGKPEDITHLLAAGLYNAARADREAGDTTSAERLTEELARQRPGDPGVGFLVVRSLLIDRHDPAAAMASLDSLTLPPDNPRLVLQAGMLRSEVFVAMGHPDSARAALQAVLQKYPDNPMVQRVVGEATAKLP
jgi:predicted Zn-dependent protease